MAKIYYDDDADLGLLKGKKVAIIGYGIQGRPHALNLRDSGLDVLVAELQGTKNYDQAISDGFKPASAQDAAREGQVIQILTQDHVQGGIYRRDVAQHMKAGKALGFAHGFNIHYNQIVPPADVDVFMIAPKGPGSMVRALYEQGRGVPALVAVHQDASGKAKQVALAYAKGIGATRAGVIETTFKEETETDLFGEQAVLCGGVSELIRAGFDVLIEAGYQPEIAYYEVCHELKLIVDLIHEEGIMGMRQRVSNTAAYGDMTRGRRVITEKARQAMRQLLAEVQDGTFAREWILENQANRPVWNALWRRDSRHLIEKVGAELRAMMPWLKKK
jgi:ketol-acid reductoisomerase